MSRPKKPRLLLTKLTPLGKTLLLSHFITVPKSDENDSEDEYRPPRSFQIPIVNLLMTSKSFLHLAQRRKDYEFRILELEEMARWHFKCEFAVDSMSGEYASCFLSFKQLKILIKFMQPQKFNINLDTITHFEASEAFKEVLKLTNGRIKLNIANEKSKIVPVISILMKNHEKIKEIKCKADLLSETGLVPCLNLDSCELYDLACYDQLNVILQHNNIKELTLHLNNDETFFGTRCFDPSPFLGSHVKRFAPDLSVTSLTFKSVGALDWIQRDEFLKKTAKLIKFLPNLKDLKFDLKICPVSYSFDSENVYNYFVDFYKDCCLIQKSAKSETKLEFKFDRKYELDDIGQYSNEWYTRLKQHLAFANAKDINICNGPIYNFEHKIEEDNFSFSIQISILCPTDIHLQLVLAEHDALNMEEGDFGID